MRTSILVSTALAVGVVALPVAAEAQVVLRGFGGASMPTDIEANYYGYDAELSSETGFVIGGAVGVRFGDFLLEGEIANRKADLDEVTILGASYDIQDADISATSFMANGWYRFKTSSNMSVYIGGGAGMSNVEASLSGYGSEDSTEFSWQLGGGLTFDTSSGFSYGLGYRYFNVPEVDDFELDFSTHELIFEISKSF